MRLSKRFLTRFQCRNEEPDSGAQPRAGNRLKRRESLRPAPEINHPASKVSAQFSNSLLQMNTSPLPQPQSNFTRQNGRPCAPAMASARLSTSNVKGTSMTTSMTAVPRTATPASKSTPQNVSNQGNAAAIEINKKGLLTRSYCRTSFKKSAGCTAFVKPI